MDRRPTRAGTASATWARLSRARWRRSCRSTHDAHRKIGHAEDEVGRQPAHLTVEHEPDRRTGDLFVQRRQLDGAKRGTDAPVDAGTEAQMPVRAAGDVESVRIGELRLVPVGRDRPERDRIAGPDLLVPHSDITRRDSMVVGVRRAPPQDLVQRAVEQAVIRAQPLVLFRPLHERYQPVARAVSGGLVTAYRAVQAVVEDLLLPQRLTAQLAGPQDADQAGVVFRAAVPQDIGEEIEDVRLDPGEP